MDYSIIGITQFATKSSGFSGKFKQEPKDFVVQEILTDGSVASLDPKPSVTDIKTEYTRFTLVKRDWNQDTILQNIARFSGNSRKRLSYAGTKDKFALTSQKISAWKIYPDRLSKIKIKDVQIGDFEEFDKRLELGDLWGNRFTIKITDVKNPKKAAQSCEETFAELEKLGGMPNFFGQQRFGMRRNNHIVGKYLLQENIEGACKEFLTVTTDDEQPEGKAMRVELAKQWPNFKEVGQFPRFMRFENAIINQLIKHPADFVGAFKKLSKNLYKIFTHAYQSNIFNILLSERLKKGESLAGEGILLGYDSDLSDKEKKFLEKDNLSQEKLRIKQFPEASVKGGPRKWLAEIKNWECKPGKDFVTIKFDLEKGAYATILLRELLKA
ncbi:MAG: tRNA pseudouridine(13) synthase TruD [Candidatus Undinarchaeales archaeon]|jgi:tRNA pseudouridine13 synthase|nr:tRNA pseudouridine(13) synthase TruD [Candidatus Undinarchaeales archaeon]